MFLTNIKMALRQLFRYKIFTLINVSGLALGLATCLLIYLWVQDELGYDRYHENTDNLYRVVENQYYAGQPVFPVAVTPGPLAAALKEKYPAIVNSTRLTRPYATLVEVGDQMYQEPDRLMASPAFFEMFTYPFIQGDAATALDLPQSVVLSETLASKYFGTEDPMGRIIRLGQDLDFTVTGVMEDVPANSHFRFSLVIPFLTMEIRGNNLDSWGSNGYFTYVQLQPQADYEEVNAEIVGLIKENNEGSVTDIYLQPLTSIHLHSDFTADIGGHGDYQYVLLFSIIAPIILLIACINFMNLSTARSAGRAKEVGMRKVVGARRVQIGLQFIGESMFMVLLAAGLALLLVVLLLPMFNNLAAKELALGQLSTAQLTMIGGAVLLTGLLAGSYPALFLSSFQPAQVLRGSLATGARNALFRKVLVVSQFTLAISLVIGTVVINGQLKYISQKKLGYNKDNLIFMGMGQAVRPKFETLRSTWENSPGVISVTRTNGLPTYLGNSTSGFDWEGRDPDETILIHIVRVDHNYQRTLGLEMAAGRFYSLDYPSDTSEAIVINEEAARIMGYSDPIGKRVSAGDDDAAIIGVVKDFHFKSVHKKIEPLIMIYSDRFSGLALIKIESQNLPATLASIEAGWNEVTGGIPFNYTFLDEVFDRLYRTEQRMSSIINYFSFLAIFISSLGLFGLSSFMTEQRTKEIGIRKVLGASVIGLTAELVRDFNRWVVAANLLAWPLAWYVMSRWLDNFAYSIDLGVGPFILAGLGALAIALATVSYHSVSVARANPVDSLRYE